MSKKKVLIPISDPHFSLQVLPHLQNFLNPKESELVLLHVEKEPQTIHIDRPLMDPVDIFRDEAEYAFRVNFADEMKPVVDQLQSQGFDVTTDALFGKPAHAIEEHLENAPVDMVAIATHGRTGFDKLMSGSVTEHILHHTHIPVLIFHPSPDDKAT